MEKLDTDIARQWALFGLREISEQLEHQGAVLSAKRLNALIPIIEAELKCAERIARIQVNKDQNTQSRRGHVRTKRKTETNKF